MSIGTHINYEDQATPQMRHELRGLQNPVPLHAAMGKRAEKELRAHFLQKNSTGNKQGWPRTNFWSRRIRSSTVLTGVDAGGATVDIADPAFAQKLFGGTIHARQAKFLSLPARAEAYGKSPREFKDLHFIPTRSGGILVQNQQTQFKRTKSGRISGQTEVGGGVFYFLVKSVVTNPDPTALPTNEKMGDAMNEEIFNFLERSRA